MSTAAEEIRKDLNDKGVNVNTVEGFFVEKLCNLGMFHDQAKAVMDVVIKNDKKKLVTWHRPIEEYPDQMKMVLWVGIKDTALEWIDVNAPMAWFRPMFE